MTISTRDGIIDGLANNNNRIIWTRRPLPHRSSGSIVRSGVPLVSLLKVQSLPLLHTAPRR